MRILVLIIMVISFLVGGASSGFLKANLDSRTADLNFEQLEALKLEIEAAKKDGIDLSKSEDPALIKNMEILDKTPSKSTINMAGILGLILTIASALMIIMAFMKKGMVKIVAGIVLALAVVLWFLTPTIEATMTSGADPKSIALIAMIALAISAACAFISQNMHIKKVETA